MTTRPEQRSVVLRDATLREVAYDFRLILRITAFDGSYDFVMERGFEIEGTRYSVSEAPWACVAPLVALVGRPISRFIAFEDGSAALEFPGGLLLTALPGDRYESWQFPWPGPNASFLVGGPGGGLITFDRLVSE